MFTVEQRHEYAKLMVVENYSTKQIMEISGAGTSAVARWEKQLWRAKRVRVKKARSLLCQRQQRIELIVQMKNANHNYKINELCTLFNVKLSSYYYQQQEKILQPKDGKAHVLNDEQFQYMLTKISENRYPEKNTLIMQLSFKLALRVQEISLLRIKEVVDLSSKYNSGYKIYGLLILPKRFTKSTRARKTLSVRRSVRFSLDDFESVV